MERVMATLLQHFALHIELEIHLMLIGRKREILQDIPDRVFIHKPDWPFEDSKRTWHTLKTLAFIRQKTISIQPDFILSFGEMWNNLVLLSLLGLPYPVYLSDRSKPEKDLGQLQNWLRDKLYPMSAGYIAQTEQARKAALKNKWNNNIQVIGNPISKISCQESNREKIILSVGRLIPTKHFDRLIHVFNQCQTIDWKLIIVGGDSNQMKLSKLLETQVQELGLQDRIIITGQQINVTPYYCRSAIFAFMSTSEGFPNVLGEALAAGCACIAYDCSAGPADLIDDEVNGFLIKEGDESKYIERLQQLMDKSELREQFGKAAQEKAQQFASSKIAKQYLDFITRQDARTQ